MAKEEIDEITLEDVELAIRILETFIRKVERARRVLRKFHKIAGYGRRSELMELAEIIGVRLAEKRISRREHEEPLETELSEEDLERFKKLKEKIEKKQIKPIY